MSDQSYTYRARDPFARENTVRQIVPIAFRRACDWCGNRPGKFQYGFLKDGLNKQPQWTRRTGSPGTAAFCDAKCWRAYTT